MSTPKLARLERVSLRDAWKSEPADFTPWLAREENLALLAETLEMELELEAQEREVGPFRADILCTDSSTGDWVLIENQLERTDHTHLGQLLTYAAGLKAVTIVWIADGFADEHRAALDWLNEITDDTVNFFGLEIALWRIGESDLAPKFNVMSQSNDWTRKVKEQSQNLGSTEQLQLEYWTAFRDFLEKNGSAVRPNKAAAASWMTFRSGIRRLGLGASVSVQKKSCGRRSTPTIRRSVRSSRRLSRRPM